MKNKLFTMIALLAMGLFTFGAQAQDQDQVPPPPPEGQVQTQSQTGDAPSQYPPNQDPSNQDSSNPASSNQDAADHGVARVSLIRGAVSTQRGDDNNWSAAVLNAPLVSGDKVSTGDDSRAEVQLDYANILRLSDRSQATISELGQNQIQVQVGQGIVNYDVFKDSGAAAEIDTPNTAVHPTRGDGSFRVAILPNGDTEVIVRKGEADIDTPQGATHVHRGQMVTVRGADPNTHYQIVDAPSKDSWDRWNSDRDEIISSAKSWNHTDPYYTGSQDLDAYGQWSNVPDYGSVWIPAVGPGWVPYRDGRWVWEPYWGWTWVSYEPWGWAPYHYGRWFLYGNSWAWWPGPVVVGFGRPFYRPIWAPAYVSFFGFGGGVGFGFGFGSVGWLPIGPCDPFFPWWGGFRGRFGVVAFNNFNFHDHRFGGFRPLHGGERFSNFRMAERNENFRRSISTMDANRFGTGGVRAHALAAGEFRSGRMMTGNLPVVPSRASLSASNRAGAASTIHNNASQHFFGRQTANHSESFERQASQVQNSIQRNSHFTPVHADGRQGTQANMNAHGNNVPRPGFNGGGNNHANSPANTGWRNGNESANHNVAGAQSQPGFHNNQTGFHNNVPPNTGWRNGNESANHNVAGAQNQSVSHNQAGFHNNIPRPNSSAAPQAWRNPSSANENRNNDNRNNENRNGMNEGRMNEDRTNNMPRPGSNQGSASGNWRQSYPQSHVASPEQNGGSRNYSRPEMNSGRNYSAPRSYSRPPLDMRQPVVRSSGRSGGGFSGAERSSGGGHSSGGGGFHGGGGGGGFHGGGGGGGGNRGHGR